MAEDEQTSGWQLTESDPAVFTELLRLLGTPLIMDELYTLDYATLSADPLNIISPVQALIFLFKWTADREGDDIGEGGARGPKTGGVYDPEFAERGGFYVKQVVNNACATLAIVNALGNIPELQVGDVLGNIFSFGVGMDAWVSHSTRLLYPTTNALSPMPSLDPQLNGAQTLGELLTSSSDLRSIHNSLSPPSAISLDGLNLPKGEAEDAYHFVVYTPVGGSLVELDGLKRDAVNHGKIDEGPGGGWIEKALEIIQKRIEMYPAGSVDFNLQAVRPDPIPILSSTTPNLHLTASDIQDLLHAEQMKRQRWAFENAVRRHNHLGLAVGLLQALAKASLNGEEGEGSNGLWQKTIQGATEVMKTRIAKRREMMALAGKGGKLPEGMDLDD